MDTLKNISFSIALFIIGAFFVLLGLSGEITISNSSLTIQESWAKIVSAIIGLALVIAAIYLEARYKLSSKEPEKIKERRAVGDHEIYLNRKEIHWSLYNEKVSNRFWGCGTSLIGVFERGLIQKYANKGVK